MHSKTSANGCWTRVRGLSRFPGPSVRAFRARPIRARLPSPVLLVRGADGGSSPGFRIGGLMGVRPWALVLVGWRIRQACRPVRGPVRTRRRRGRALVRVGWMVRPGFSAMARVRSSSGRSRVRTTAKAAGRLSPETVGMICSRSRFKSSPQSASGTGWCAAQPGTPQIAWKFWVDRCPKSSTQSGWTHVLTRVRVQAGG